MKVITSQKSKLEVLDLFAGVGGLSLGAARAGFRVTGAVDFNPRAMLAHNRNFPNTKHLTMDLSSVSGDQLLAELGILRPDGIIGGPPCQGFSSMGHRKLTDQRNSLFHKFFSLVSNIRPRFFLAENVTGILDPKYQSLLDAAFKPVEKDYHLLKGVEVCAADYGAPTLRKRVLFFGVLKTEVKKIPKNVFRPDAVEPVYVLNALDGLPNMIRGDWQSEKQGWRLISSYADTEFGRRLMGDVPEGVGCVEALQRIRDNREVSGCLGTIHSVDVKSRYRALKPGGKDKVSKSVRLKLDGFCPTLRAGTGPELGSYQAVRPIHPTAPRVITPREAARLQGFPDWFQFDETKWHSFRMIGNSVSPILAEQILKKIQIIIGDSR
jgi:DNA (cytosine-5)-methyltransferase 1